MGMLGIVGELEAFVGVGVADAEAHLEPRLHLSVDVGAEREALELRADDGTVLVHVSTRDEVFHLVVTALCAHLMLVLKGGLEDGVLPVGAQAEQRGVAVLCVGRTFALVHQVVVVLCKLAQVHHIEAFGLAVPCHHAVVTELGVARLSALGGDEHHAVGTLCTVDGGG